MDVGCGGTLNVDDTDGSAKATIAGYVSDGWITCIEQGYEVSVEWNGADLTTVKCASCGQA